MLYVKNDSGDPYFNLALEEYLFMQRHDLGPLFMLWQDKPVVVVGRNQNTREEINMNFIREKGIAVVRRLSGGGAVYHDLGNLNFTYILEQAERELDFARYTVPVIKALEQMGITASFTGRNDLTIGGRKFSGNAQFRQRERILHHGTLLFEVNLENMEQALAVAEDKITSHGVKSVRSRVSNIVEHLNTPFTLQQFRELLIDAVREDYGLIGEYELKPDDIRAVEKLRLEKYCSWEWNFGHSPAYNIKRSRRFDWGKVDVFLEVQEGFIKEAHIFGDFFSPGDIDELCSSLSGRPYRSEAISHSLAGNRLEHYFPFMSEKDLMELMGVKSAE
ncbi:MAG: lipoate--protein ligase [Syntrophomonas sp.]|uniref:lipoate--protein ligase n=1 Tax=Syntrophomonas sp. TaxID=2053627 RepID=UPI0026078C21|nr:lipoate--protein ligase [Syntrophomonas sp.]MDD2511001.1 lipoate--protein ligase [Syntrophomonas sp.]MDD3878931.1 lipoate--protein ligase [Syntrophomonas sp.]MDD4626615.1 lipoate--protein ligase [Syntrophomonas sp.]